MCTWYIHLGFLHNMFYDNKRKLNKIKDEDEDEENVSYIEITTDGFLKLFVCTFYKHINKVDSSASSSAKLWEDCFRLLAAYCLEEELTNFFKSQTQHILLGWEWNQKEIMKETVKEFLEDEFGI